MLGTGPKHRPRSCLRQSGDIKVSPVNPEIVTLLGQNRLVLGAELHRQEATPVLMRKAGGSLGRPPQTPAPPPPMPVAGQPCRPQIVCFSVTDRPCDRIPRAWPY